MIDDIGGAIGVGLLIALALAVFWAMTEASKRKQAEDELRMLFQQYQTLKKENNALKIQADMIHEIWGE